MKRATVPTPLSVPHVPGRPATPLTSSLPWRAMRIAQFWLSLKMSVSLPATQRSGSLKRAAVPTPSAVPVVEPSVLPTQWVKVARRREKRSGGSTGGVAEGVVETILGVTTDLGSAETDALR